MDKRKRFLTREEAGVILGGDTRPLSESTVRRLIREGRIRVTADSRKLQRIIASSVYDLAENLEQGGSLWHGMLTVTATDRSMKVRKDRGAGSRKSPMGTAETSDEGQKVKKTPRLLKLL